MENAAYLFRRGKPDSMIVIISFPVRVLSSFAEVLVGVSTIYTDDKQQAKNQIYRKRPFNTLASCSLRTKLATQHSLLTQH